MKNKIINSTIVLALMAISVVYGVMIHRDHIFPYTYMQIIHQMYQQNDDENIKKSEYGKEEENSDALIQPIEQNDEHDVDVVLGRVLSDEENATFKEIDPLYYQTDVDSLITIHSPEDVNNKRSRLIEYIWGDQGLPTRLPDKVERDFSKPEYKEMDNVVERVDRLIINMDDQGMNSIAYHFIPQNHNGKLLIWHDGHNQSMSIKYVHTFLKQGFSVLAFCMPLYCDNTVPVVNSPRFGNIRIISHDYFIFLTTKTGHPIKYFIEPVIVGINYITHEYKYQYVDMVGYSGGGWTTTVASAIDPRIRSSIPVAGSYPFFLREHRDRDHYESQLLEVYDIANYLELYVMGGYGEGRRQIQITNQYDPCCYAGIKGQLYMEHVSKRVEELGAGSWELFIDPYDDHGLSAQALQLIIDTLSGK